MKTRGRLILIAITALLVLAFTAELALAGQEQTGRGGPSGPHYNLNIIGKKWEDKEPINCEVDLSAGEHPHGHRIFVKLGEPPASGKPPKTTRIYLTSCEKITGDPNCMDFGVIDCDGTDGRAEFMLPDPNGGKEGCTRYSVWVRPLGKPNGKAEIRTCVVDPNEPGGELCSIEYVELNRTTGKKTFQNVSKELLTICANVCIERDPSTGECLQREWMRLYLFDPMFEEYLWKYDNNGLKLAQLRFYYEEDCSRSGEWGCP